MSDPYILFVVMVEKRRQRGSKNGGFLEPSGLGLGSAAHQFIFKRHTPYSKC